MAAPFHERVKRVFYDASHRPPRERSAFLDEACRNAKGVRSEVESLLGFYRDEVPTRPTRQHGGKRSPRRFHVGRVVGGRYRIAGLLGRGGVGEVYRAWDLSLEMEVALKVLIVASPLARMELVQEVRLAREVTHPAVCRVYDIAEADGETFFTMEWIDGERLGALLKRSGPLAPVRVFDLGRQLCAALAAAHEKSIVHRDLKPSNVLVDRDGRAHVTDFGVAVCLARPIVRDLLPIGTPRYMAPEQLQEGGEITARTDVHALGLLLHEMLTGLRPEPGRRPPPLLRVPGLDPRFAAVVHRAVSPEPRERYASAAEMGGALGLGAAPETSTPLLGRLPAGCPVWHIDGSAGDALGPRAGGASPVGRLPCEILGSGRELPH
jgi:serine/threonine protein kinase